MTIDELIRDTIDDAAGPAPAPDLDRIHRQGRRRSAVRVGGAALATLAVVAAGTYAVQTVGGPQASDELPVSIRSQGPAAAFKTYSPPSVHFAGKTYEPAQTSTLDASAMTSAGVIYVSGDSNGTPYLLDRSGEEIRLGDPVNPEGKRTWGSEVVSDVDRRTAVWSADLTGPEVRLNLFDAGSRQVTDSITFDPATVAGSPGATWGGLDTIQDGVAYGRLRANGAQQSFAWDPSRPNGEQVYVASDPGTVIAAVGTDRLVLDGTGDAYGGPGHEPLDSSVRVSRVPDEKHKAMGVQSATLSPDGNWALVDPDAVNDVGVPIDGPDEESFNEASEDQAALNLKTGKIQPFHSQGIVEATFDDDGSVLMIEITPDGGDQLIDCALPSEKCTTVLDDVPNGGPVEMDDAPVAHFLD